MRQPPVFMISFCLCFSSVFCKADYACDDKPDADDEHPMQIVGVEERNERIDGHACCRHAVFFGYLRCPVGENLHHRAVVVGNFLIRLNDLR